MELPNEIPTMHLGNGFALRSHRVTLEDARDYWSCYNDPSVRPFIPEDCVPLNLEDAKKDIEYLLESFRKRKGMYWAIVPEETDRMVGAISIHSIDHYHCRAEIAYDLHSSMWGLGIAYAACRNVMHYAFSKLGINRIEATTILENTPSMCLLQKLGLGLEGILEKYKMHRGKFVDIAIFGMPVAQYRAYIAGKEVHQFKQKKGGVVRNGILNAYWSRRPVYGATKPQLQVVRSVNGPQDTRAVRQNQTEEGLKCG